MVAQAPELEDILDSALLCPSATEPSHCFPLQLHHPHRQEKSTHRNNSNFTMDKMSMALVPQSQLDNQEGEEWMDHIDSDWDEDDDLSCEDVDLQEGILTAKERIFLEVFPFLKLELQEAIRDLHDDANGFDEVRQVFTKTHMVTGSMGVFSGVLGIMGLSLTPAMVVGSLGLSTAIQGLGAITEVTITSFLEYSQDERARTRLSRLARIHDRLNQEAKKKRAKEVDLAVDTGRTAYNCGDRVINMNRNISAFLVDSTPPSLTAAAKRFLNTGQVSAGRMKQMRKFFDGTVLVMTKSVHILKTISSLGTVLNNWKQLKEGGKSRHAERLRAQARQMERWLMVFTQCYESLQQKLLQERMACESSLEGALENLSLPTARPGEAGTEITGEPEDTLSPGWKLD
ncbi:apolipoprotein L6-like isoform X2 [Tamandua tetradactyla]|uniref:apolipoprotein L6-like isoform X2 n=1 Tax=Tamandua tetradactyla TaxID=48850 RepID=UPI004054214D